MNTRNGKSPNDFSDSFDQNTARKHHKGNRLKQGDSAYNGNDDVRDGYRGKKKDERGQFHKVIHPKIAKPFTGRDGSWDDRVGPQYEVEREKNDLEERMNERQELLNNGWKWSSGESEEGSGGDGFDSDDESDSEDMDELAFEAEQLKHDERRLDRLEFEIEETENEEDVLLKRFNRVQSRVQAEKQILSRYNRY